MNDLNSYTFTPDTCFASKVVKGDRYNFLFNEEYHDRYFNQMQVGAEIDINDVGEFKILGIKEGEIALIKRPLKLKDMLDIDIRCTANKSSSGMIIRENVEVIISLYLMDKEFKSLRVGDKFTIDKSHLENYNCPVDYFVVDSSGLRITEDGCGMLTIRGTGLKDTRKPKYYFQPEEDKLKNLPTIIESVFFGSPTSEPVSISDEGARPLSLLENPDRNNEVGYDEMWGEEFEI